MLGIECMELSDPEYFLFFGSVYSNGDTNYMNFYC